ncbi:uncharacterized protein RJT21DRAFT_3677 [Scheffersomyces amazonensis]|uniref:uncharacterized protein n=1 Tax=Scheffersomyces amazonensis TaxID=1078765 RepID=UPI00315DD2BA
MSFSHLNSNSNSNVVPSISPSDVLHTAYDFNTLFNSQHYTDNNCGNTNKPSDIDSNLANKKKKRIRANTLLRTLRIKWLTSSSLFPKGDASTHAHLNRTGSRTEEEIQADNIVNDIYDTHLFLDLKFDSLTELDQSKGDSQPELQELDQPEMEMVNNEIPTEDDNSNENSSESKSFDSKTKSNEIFHTSKLDLISNTTVGSSNSKKSKSYELNLSSLFPPSPTIIKKSFNKLSSSRPIINENDTMIENHQYSSLKSFRWWKSDPNSVTPKRIVPDLSRHPHVIKRNSNVYSLEEFALDNSDERIAQAIIKQRKVYKE